MVEFNKMYVMLPMILASRQINGEDPKVVLYLRIAYFSVQTIIVLITLYTYYRASMIASGKNEDKKLIYVPVPAQPFADPNGKKKYTETTFTTHILSQARNLVGSTLFGICLTSGLHWYRGMVVGLAIQSVMGPLSLIENPLARSLLFGKGLSAEDKIFGEKTASDLTPEDEIVDSSGNPVELTETTAAASSSPDPNETKKIENTKSFEHVLLDTWDEGAKANLEPLMELLTDKNCNFQSKESRWTPLMIVSGLVGVKGCDSAIKHLLALGADPSMIDTEGWNAMHWAAFHGSIQAAKTLAQETRDSLSLWTIADKEGKTPRMLAESENNVDLIKFLVELEEGAEDSTEGKKDR